MSTFRILKTFLSREFLKIKVLIPCVNFFLRLPRTLFPNKQYLKSYINLKSVCKFAYNIFFISYKTFSFHKFLSLLPTFAFLLLITYEIYHAIWKLLSSSKEWVVNYIDNDKRNVNKYKNFIFYLTLYLKENFQQ